MLMLMLMPMPFAAHRSIYGVLQYHSSPSGLLFSASLSLTASFVARVLEVLGLQPRPSSYRSRFPLHPAAEGSVND